MRFLYIIVRGTSIFSFPILKKVRNLVYQKYFNAKGLFVAEHVMIKPSHRGPNSKIVFGKDVKIDTQVLIDYTAPLKLGDYVTISEGAKIFTHNHSVDDKIDIQYSEIQKNELVIEEYAWIGANAVILPSVKKIGRGAIVAAGAIVTKPVNEFEVVAGNPAKVIKIRSCVKEIS